MEENKYEGFSLSLALVDAIPVIIFVIMSVLLSIIYPNVLFIIGAILCSLAGLLKVVWKIVIAVSKKDIKLFAKQFRYTMSVGFTLIIVSLFVLTPKVDFTEFIKGFTSLPSLIFFILGFIGMTTMFVLAFKLDKTDAKSNWIEQGVNSFAQLMFLLGVLFILVK